MAGSHGLWTGLCEEYHIPFIPLEAGVCRFGMFMDGERMEQLTWNLTGGPRKLLRRQALNESTTNP